MLLLVLAACAHHAPTVSAAARDAMPELPSPTAPSYSHLVATPRDPVVASVMAGAPWEVGLAGGASGVALAVIAGETAGPRLVAWKTAAAGYPWLVDVAEKTWVATGGVPDDLAVRARELAREPLRDVGLVRARAKQGDLWVLLSAKRPYELPEVPRQVHVGDTLPTLGLAARAWAPSGAGRPVPTVFDEPGEWLVEVFEADHVVTRFPVYVGVQAPPTPPILDGPAPAGTDLASTTVALVTALRTRLSQDAPTADAMLASVARGLLHRDPPPTNLVDTVRAAGFVHTPVAGARCEAPDVPSCLDAIYWSGPDRSVLLGGYAHLEAAAEAVEGGVRLVLLGAD